MIKMIKFLYCNYNIKMFFRLRSYFLGVRYLDGYYIGCTKFKKPNGWGEFYSSYNYWWGYFINGNSTYRGYFKDGIFQDGVKEYHHNKDFYIETFKYGFKNKDVEILYYANQRFSEKSCDSYLGEVLDYKRHGEGTLWYSNGDKYQGSFHLDKRHGEGIYYYKNGNWFQGNFLMDKRHGKGFLHVNTTGSLLEMNYDNGVLCKK